MPEIIVGVDGTERGEDALLFARRYSAVTGARLALAAVYPYNELLGPPAHGGRLRDDAGARSPTRPRLAACSRSPSSAARPCS
jgi:nucleotide-binding universal stress UspA family protein